MIRVILDGKLLHKNVQSEGAGAFRSIGAGVSTVGYTSIRDKMTREREGVPLSLTLTLVTSAPASSLRVISKRAPPLSTRSFSSFMVITVKVAGSKVVASVKPGPSA